MLKNAYEKMVLLCVMKINAYVYSTIKFSYRMYL